MANPLSPLSRSQENIRSPQSTIRQTHTSITFERTMHREEREQFYDVDEYASSPLSVNPDITKYLQSRSPIESQSPRKMVSGWGSPTKRSTPQSQERTKTIELRQPDEDKENSNDDGTSSLKSSVGFDPDETCASAFSMVPTADMTRFARLGESTMKVTPPRSPTKAADTRTPTSARTRTPGTAIRPDSVASPTPRRQRPATEDSTTQLLEFTEQLPFNGRYSPRKPVPGSASPSKDANNLLDFDLPPAPTPRSLPSVSAREVEALKANFLSQISSLKATIDGKDATIQSLIDTKDDAERRVGEVSESLAEANDAKTNLVAEKADWEKRDNEVRAILRDVKSELVHREIERDGLSLRLDESERRREEAEARIREADAKIAGLQSDLEQSSSRNDSSSEGSKTPNKAVEVAVEKVARELHQLYKQKHEAKVTALKKSYEGRWEKKVRELESRIADLAKENEDLKNGREATMTKVMPGMIPRVDTTDAATSPRKEAADAAIDAPASTAHADLEHANSEAMTEIQMLRTQIESLEDGMVSSHEDSRRLQAELDTSRAENSDLVAVVEEMLHLDRNSTASGAPAHEAPPSTSRNNSRPRGSSHARTGSQGDAFRASGNEHSGATRPPSRNGGAAAPKASGLARPGFGFGGPGGAVAAAGRMGLGRPAPGPARSGIMSSIERMGRGRAGDA